MEDIIINDNNNVSKLILKLEVIKGPNKKKAILNEQSEIIIGRHSKCGLSIPDDIKVSRFHCKVYKKDDKFYLIDLGSSNGTIFKEELIENAVELSNADIFQIGETVIKVSIGTSEILKEEENNTEIPSQLLDTIHCPFDELEKMFSIQDLEQETMKVMSLKAFEEHKKEDLLIENISENKNQKDKEDINIKDLKKIIDFPRGELLKKEKDIYIEYFYKEKMEELKEVKKILYQHNFIIKPDEEGEIEGRIYKIYKNIMPIKLPLNQIHALELTLALLDIFYFLEYKGIKISKINLLINNIYYHTKFNMYKISLNVVKNSYKKIKGYNYSILNTLLFLLIGKEVPVDVLGINKEEIIKISEKFSSSLKNLINDIIENREKNIERIKERLKLIFYKYLFPVSWKEENYNINILKTNKELIYIIKEIEETCSISYRKDIKDRILKRWYSNKGKETFREIGEDIYNYLLPIKIKKFLERIEESNIILKLDEELIDIPWELIYHENKFFLSKFNIIRVNLTTNKYKYKPLSLIKITIVYNSNIIQDKEIDEFIKNLKDVGINYIKKENTNKDNYFNFIQNITSCDILHIITPFKYNNVDPIRSSWILGDGELKLTLLESSKNKPKLIFSQNVIKDEEDYENSKKYIFRFTSQVYNIGIPYVISTLEDRNVNNFKLIVYFYKKLLENYWVNSSLYEFREEIIKENFKNFISYPIFYGNIKKPLLIEKT